MHRTRSGMDGQTVRLLYASQSSFGGIKTTKQKFNYQLDYSMLFHKGDFMLKQAHEILKSLL